MGSVYTSGLLVRLGTFPETSGNPAAWQSSPFSAFDHLPDDLLVDLRRPFASAVNRAQEAGSQRKRHGSCRIGAEVYLLNLNTHMDYPDADHWILSYGQLNAVMQWSENRDYYVLPLLVAVIAVNGCHGDADDFVFIPPFCSCWK